MSKSPETTIKGVVHKSVLVDEVLTYLDLQPHKVYLDVTFGGGGHTRAILEREPSCKVIAMDWDASAIDTFGSPLQEEFGDRITFVWSNFGDAYRKLKKLGITTVDGVLADFGTSQVQIFEKEGFSFSVDTPLDMRMSAAHYKVTAALVINKASEEKLREIFFQLGEERNAKRIAQAILEERKKRRIKTTLQLAQLIERVVPRTKHTKTHPATKVFQALRMYVNHELDNLHSFLTTIERVIRPGGHLVCISFHSLEDRMVKDAFRQGEIDGVWKQLTKKVVVASDEELAQNPSSRSAKLRAVEILK
jgi:16S rRNA (cytosine1402-N4)-methyltransferase